MDDDLIRDIGSPLASDDDEVSPNEEGDDLDDNFDRELREAERELEETEQPRRQIKVEEETDEDE